MEREPRRPQPLSLEELIDMAIAAWREDIEYLESVMNRRGGTAPHRPAALAVYGGRPVEGQLGPDRVGVGSIARRAVA